MTTSYLFANNFLVETSLPLNSLSLSDLEQTFVLVGEQLSIFANDPDFNQNLVLAFGEGFDTQATQNLAQAWQNDDFSNIPTIELLTASQLNGANGAFAASTNRIYLSTDFLSQNHGDVTQIISVVLEEIGHYVDAQINPVDALGDEGAIFESIVSGNILSTEELNNLRQEDDSATIMIDGNLIQIEQAIGIGGIETIWSQRVGNVVGYKFDVLKDFLGISENQIDEEILFLDEKVPLLRLGGKLGELGVSKQGNRNEAADFELGFGVNSGFGLGEVDLDLPLFTDAKYTLKDDGLFFDIAYQRDDTGLKLAEPYFFLDVLGFIRTDAELYPTFRRF